jgi:hypothetical protein
MGYGDIDGDGHTDLVLQGVWLRNPGGPAARTATSWSQHTIGSAHPSFKALVVDLNGDGKMDVVFSSSEDNADVDWWTPESDDPRGKWIKHTILPSAEKVHTLQAADMDRDGDIDLVLAQMHTSSAQEIMVLFNMDRNGLEWKKQVVDTGGLHNGVVIDIDNDDDFDIFGANWAGNPPVRLWINHLESASQWEYIQVTDQQAQTFGLAFGDVNQDMQVDIVSGPYWYQNPGGDLNREWQQFALPEGMHAILTLDVDGSGRLDVIAMKNEGDIALYWLKPIDPTAGSWDSIKIGTVPKASHDIGSQGHRLGQVESGGKPQVLVSSGQGIFYFRIPNAPEAGNWPRVHVSSNPSDEGFSMGDIDGDGDLDIAATTGDSKRVEWYENPGSGSDQWTVHVIGNFDEALYPDRTEVADLNGDGFPDIIVTEENGEASGAETFWWQNPGDPKQREWARYLIIEQGTTNSMDKADMDGNGFVDLILAEHRGSKKLSILANNGQGEFEENIISIGIESHLGARTVDIDGDSDLDIVSIAWDDFGKIHLWVNQTEMLPPAKTIPKEECGRRQP